MDHKSKLNRENPNIKNDASLGILTRTKTPSEESRIPKIKIEADVSQAESEGDRNDPEPLSKTTFTRVPLNKPLPAEKKSKKARSARSTKKFDPAEYNEDAEIEDVLDEEVRLIKRRKIRDSEVRKQKEIEELDARLETEVEIMPVVSRKLEESSDDEVEPNLERPSDKTLNAMVRNLASDIDKMTGSTSSNHSESDRTKPSINMRKYPDWVTKESVEELYSLTESAGILADSVDKLNESIESSISK